MHLQIDRRPPPIEDVVQRMKTRLDRDGIHIEKIPSPPLLPPTTRNENRRQRSLRSCHLPAEPKPRCAQPRDSGAYVPEMAARIEDDPNLTDGARRCARKIMEYVYRKTRESREAEITVSYLATALGRCSGACSAICASWRREAISALPSSMPAHGCAPGCWSRCWLRCFHGIAGKNGR